MSNVSPEALKDIHHGLIYGFLSNSDDKDTTAAAFQPLQLETLTMITGSEENARRPLSAILRDHMGLTLDCHVDVRGITPGGHAIDTQGYIAHNDDVIALSYRPSTSKTDYLTDFQMTTSVWDIEKDSARGYSEIGSSLKGRGNGKPRVHTGFYNAFLASLPMIQQHIEPLLRADQPPRKLYVTGHSLGAALATLATCYFLEAFDWNNLPHTFCHVTAGSPRACGERMQENVQGLIDQFDSNKVQIYRVNTEDDVVVKTPPKELGYRHIVSPVVIQRNGQIIVRSSSQAAKGKSSENNGSNTFRLEKIAHVISSLPESIRMHMAAAYLKPVCKARGILLNSDCIAQTPGNENKTGVVVGQVSDE